MITPREDFNLSTSSSYSRPTDRQPPPSSHSPLCVRVFIFFNVYINITRPLSPPRSIAGDTTFPRSRRRRSTLDGIGRSRTRDANRARYYITDIYRRRSWVFKKNVSFVSVQWLQTRISCRQLRFVLQYNVMLIKHYDNLCVSSGDGDEEMGRGDVSTALKS